MTTEKLVAGPLRGLLATWRKYIRREMDNEESAPAGDALVYCDAMRHCADELAEALASLPSSPPHDWHGHTPDGVWHGCPEHPGPVQGPKPHAGDCSCAECVNWCQNWMPTEPVAAPAELDLSWLGKLETRFLRDEHGREIRGALWVRRSEVAEHFTRDPSPVQGVQALTVGNVTGVLFNSGVGLTAAVAQKVTAELNAIAAGQRAEGAEAADWCYCYQHVGQSPVICGPHALLNDLRKEIEMMSHADVSMAPGFNECKEWVLSLFDVIPDLPDDEAAAPPVAEKTELGQAGRGDLRHHVRCTCGWERFIVGSGTEVGPPSRSIFVPITDMLESHANLCPKMKAALGAALGSGQELREARVSEAKLALEIIEAHGDMAAGQQRNRIIALQRAALALPLAPRVPE